MIITDTQFPHVFPMGNQNQEYVSVNKITQEPLDGFSCNFEEKLHFNMAQADSLFDPIQFKMAAIHDQP